MLVYCVLRCFINSLDVYFQAGGGFKDGCSLCEEGQHSALGRV